MNKILLAGAVAVLTGCITINVYFPEAAAEDAADEFINNVLKNESENSDEQAFVPVRQSSNLLMVALDFVFPPAHAQQNVQISIDTPAIKAIEKRMADRLNGTLRSYFNQGVIGLTNDGLVEILSLGDVALPKRSALKQAVADDNRDRQAVYKEVAVANGHPEWEDDVRAAFAERWIANAPSGWKYQKSDGSWATTP